MALSPTELDSGRVISLQNFHRDEPTLSHHLDGFEQLGRSIFQSRCEPEAKLKGSYLDWKILSA